MNWAAFSQSENDVREITALMVRKHDNDTINIYHKFENRELIQTINSAKNSQEHKQLLKIESRYDSSDADEILKIFGDDVLVEIEGIAFKYDEAMKSAKERDADKISKYVSSNFQKRKQKQPLAFISTPLLSADGKHAIVYCSYSCGSLCGSGGIQFFEKVQREWKLMSYLIKWVS